MASATLSNRVDPGWDRPKSGKAARTGSSKRQFDEPVDAASSASQSQYVSFDLRSRSRKELGEIKTRLVAELDRIQRLRQRIDSGELAAARSGRNPKSTAKKAAGNARRPSGSEIGESGSGGGAPARSLGPVLSRLMKHKHAWIFNSPVDAAALGLHDYHDVVKRPMDLGTVKANVAKNLYSSPIDFAGDVRLTFNNAMLYNPKGHEIYHIAEELLARFEELFKPVYEKLEDDHRPDHQVYDDFPANSCSNVEPERAIKEVAPPIVKKTLPASSWTELEPENVKAKAKKKKQKVEKRSEQARAQSPARVQVKTVKQPKPKAKDPNKREMSLEEKHKLGVGLQSLPEEKMEQVVQIISKRNGHLRHDGDEIELDIEAVDTETLWELDRFVTNWKKLVSKIKRQALMNNNGGSGSGSVEHNEEVPQIEIVDAEMSTRSLNEGEGGNEDVDIDDDLPRNSCGPVEIEKEDGRGGAGGRVSSSSSSSSSSGSDSSSSSDSDSGSSSGSEDKAHS